MAIISKIINIPKKIRDLFIFLSNKVNYQYCYIMIAVLCFFNIYIFSHFFSGVNSFSNYNKLKTIFKKKEKTLIEVERKNFIYEKEIAMIREEIDLDYLDELSRLQLNYSKGSEKVIIYRKV